MKQRNVALSVFVLFAIILVASSISVSVAPTVNAYECPSWLNEYRCNGNWVERVYLDSYCQYSWEDWEYCDYGCVDGTNAHCNTDPYPDCDSGWLNSFRCGSNDWAQRLYRYSNCDTEWLNWEQCDYDCYNGACVDYPSCSETWLNSYRCDGNWREGLYRYSNCDTEWRNLEYCEDGCYSGMCQVRDTCGVEIYSLSFNNGIHEGESTTITVRAKNTGDIWEKVTLNIYVDNKLEQVYTDNLKYGEIMTSTLIIHPDEGTHYIKVKANADCGEQDSLTKTLTVYRTSYPSPTSCDYDNKCESWESSNCADCDYEDEPYYPDKTTVTFYPSTLDLRLYEGKVITITVDSKINQRFSVNVKGVPSDWLSYKEYVTINNEDKIYVYVTPREPGLYDLELTVNAQSEDRTFRDTVSMYVSEKVVEDTGLPVTGMITLTDAQVFIGVGVLVIIIVIALGVILLRRPNNW
ncbi:MAG: hypothetical protein ABIH55_00930 [Nanoarchaeota archaeon]